MIESIGHGRYAWKTLYQPSQPSRKTLYRNAYGLCWADLRRGWILRKYVRVDLDQDRFEEAKQFLGTRMTRTRVRLPLRTHS